MNFLNLRNIILLLIICSTLGAATQFQNSPEIITTLDQYPKRSMTTTDIVKNSKIGSKSFNNLTQSQTSFTRWKKEFTGDFGSVSLIPDMNDDGTAEVITGINDRIYLIEGDSGAILLNRSIGTVNTLDKSVIAISSSIDKDQDGRIDIVSANMTHCLLQSGVDGEVLWTIDFSLNHSYWDDTENTTRYLNPSILWIGDDINGDGNNEIYYATYALKQLNYLYCIDTIQGKVSWTLPAFKGFRTNFKRQKDLTGDGISEILTPTLSNPNFLCINGATGDVIWNFTSDKNFGPYENFDLVGDTTGDGINEIVAGDYAGVVYCLDGATGDELRRWISPVESDYEIRDICTIDTLANKVTISTSEGLVQLLIWDGQKFDSNWFKDYFGFIQCMSSIDDLPPFDGVKDLIIGSQEFKKLYAIDGSDGSEFWQFDLEGSVPRKIKTTTDLTGDGVADILLNSYSGILPSRTQYIALYDAQGPDLDENKSVKEALYLFHNDDSYLYSVNLFEDIDSNNITEILVSSQSGKITLLNGSNLNPIWYTNKTTIVERPIVQRFEDLDQDNMSEILSYGYIGEPEVENTIIRCLAGVNGVELWRLNATKVLNTTEIDPAIPYRDVNGDGITDILLVSKQSTSVDSIYILSGNCSGDINKSQILDEGFAPENSSHFRISSVAIYPEQAYYPYITPLIVGTKFGVYGFDLALDPQPLWQYECEDSVQVIELIEDITGDSTPEIIFGGFDKKITCISGEYNTTPTRLWERASPVNESQLGRIEDIQSIKDVNQDGIDDLLVGTTGDETSQSSFCLSVGDNGSILWSFVTQADVQHVQGIIDVNSDLVSNALIGTRKGKLFCIEGDANETAIQTKYLWLFERAEHRIIALLLTSDLTNDQIPEVLVGFSNGFVFAIDPTTKFFGYYNDTNSPFLEIDLFECVPGYKWNNTLHVGYNNSTFTFNGTVMDKNNITLIEVFLFQDGLVYGLTSIYVNKNGANNFSGSLIPNVTLQGGFYNFTIKVHDIYRNVRAKTIIVGIETLSASIINPPFQKDQDISVGNIEVNSTIRGFLTKKELNVYSYELVNNETGYTGLHGNLTLEGNSTLWTAKSKQKNVTDGLYFIRYRFANKSTPLSIIITSDTFSIILSDPLPIFLIAAIMIVLTTLIGVFAGIPAYRYRKRILKTQAPDQHQMTEFLDDINGALKEGKGVNPWSWLKKKIRWFRKKDK